MMHLLTSKIFMDGVEQDMTVYNNDGSMTVYNIGASNYFRMRDLGKMKMAKHALMLKPERFQIVGM